MPHRQNPTTKGRVSRNSLVGASDDTHTLSTYRTQHLIESFGIRSERAAMLATFAFGGAANDQ